MNTSDNQEILLLLQRTRRGNVRGRDPSQQSRN